VALEEEGRVLGAVHCSAAGISAHGCGPVNGRVQVSTAPLDAHWYYDELASEHGAAPRLAWYLSDVGAMRCGNESVHHTGVEFKSGDSITMHIALEARSPPSIPAPPSPRKREARACTARHA